MDTIPFSQNWNNKLTAKYYTTLRLASAKYQVGKTVNVTLKNNHLHQAEIMDCKFIMFDQLNDFIIGLDMGLTLIEGKEILRRMYPNVDFTKQRLVMSLLRVIDYKKEKATLTQADKTKENHNTHQESNQHQQEQATSTKKVYPHNLTETQVHNFRRLNQISMTYLMRQMNG